MRFVRQSSIRISYRCSLITLAAVIWSASTLQAEDRGVGAAKVSIDFLPPEPADVPPEIAGRFVPGGRNVEAHRYIVSEGYPPIPDRPKFVGLLSGTWFEMGKALGERAGDRVRCTSDIWWTKICDKKGLECTLQAMNLYERQIVALDQNQIDFLKGVTEGARAWLDQSVFAGKDHPLHAENYCRVLAASIWDCWLWGRPELPSPGCNSFAALGKATVDGKTIATQSQHTPHDGNCYLQSYVIDPPSGNMVWTVAATPNVIGLMVVNKKGVSISHHFGGATNPASLKYPGGPYRANAFGVPWWNLLLYVAINADDADQAIHLLTIGPQRYLKATGRKTLLRDGAWNWLVADYSCLAVVEASADRYAVRRPGEFTGPGWIDKDFIVCANHFLCDYSHDENGHRTAVPMTVFNVDRPNSEDRFWTLMWDVRDRYGKIDKYSAQHILGTTYIRGKETGRFIDVAQNDNGEWQSHAHAKWGIQGGMKERGLACGTNAAKVAVLDGGRSMASWILGNPSDWAGNWDEYYFDEESWTDGQWWGRQ